MHEERIKKELKAAGFGWFGLMKFTSRYLPKVIHEDEHIVGAVYGRYADKGGSLTLNEGMLIATDRRLIFIDHKPGYTNFDEMTYDVVSGLNLSTAGFTSINLYTKINDYKIRFANNVCAERFARAVENQRLERSRRN